MNMREIMVEAFEDELSKDDFEKDAFVGKALGMLFKGSPRMWTKGRRMAKLFAGKASQYLKGTRGGKWLMGPTRGARVARFGGAAAAGGAAFELGAIPFERRKKIIQVLPQESGDTQGQLNYYR